MNQELREIINDNSLGKLLVRIKPRFNQEIKNQNLANLLVNLSEMNILILPDFLTKLENGTNPLILRHPSQKNKPCLYKPSKDKILQFLVILTGL